MGATIMLKQASPYSTIGRISAWLLLIILAAPAGAGWKASREALDQRLTAGPFRIHYTLDGDDAFPPDAPPAQRRERAAAMLGRLAAQLTGADRYYREQLGLTPPLGGARYRDVRAIDVHIRALDGKTGSTGDAPVIYRYRHFTDAVPALSMSISNRWVPPGLTPEHEVFHAYQYGYTSFKNAWFLEGMARSMENAFSGRVPRTEPLPRDSAQMSAVMGRSYRADVFWNRLFSLCDPQCGSAAPARFCGAALVRATLEEYRAIDGEAARARGIDPADWPEEEQRSERNNPFLLHGLRRALEKQCPLTDSRELRDFHGVLREMAVRP